LGTSKVPHSKEFEIVGKPVLPAGTRETFCFLNELVAVTEGVKKAL
jgi:hypothetical protein